MLTVCEKTSAVPSPDGKTKTLRLFAIPLGNEKNKNKTL